MSNLSVKNRVKLFNSGMVGKTKGFNAFQFNEDPINTAVNTSSIRSFNNEIPENLYVSPPNSPMPDVYNIYLQGLNSPMNSSINGSMNSSINGSMNSGMNAPMNFSAPKGNIYNQKIASWKNRNTSKNKQYKTRANYNAKNQANLTAKLALLSQSSNHPNLSGEEHSTQYWQNKRAANALLTKSVAPTAKTYKWTVPGMKSRKNRKANRKSRKNRK